MWKALLPLLVLAPMAAAQPTTPPDVGITGVVNPVTGSVICTDASHGLDCTKVTLTSSNIDLSLLQGQLVKLYGNQTGAACPLIDVTGVQAPPSTLEWCGSPTPGCVLKFKVCPGGLSEFWLFAALEPGYLPLHPDKGTWLLGNPFFMIAQGFGGAACHELAVIVPPIPILAGLDVWLQGARRDVGPVGPITLTNAICLTITGPLPGCIAPGC
jgi:hypothetical protein